LPEFKITPHGKELPAPESLLRSLHERGFTVEIALSGPGGDSGNMDRWSALRFYQEGPADVECYLIRDEETDRFGVSIPEGAPARAGELLLHLTEILLLETQGEAQDSRTQKTWSASEFKQAHPELKPRAGAKTSWVWPLFAWGLVATSLAAYFNLPANLHVLSLAILVLTFISALGLTLSSSE
jgi:hypothetical protein